MTSSSKGVSKLSLITSCICPGNEAIFQCSVTSGSIVATTWQGTALRECNDDSINLRHSQFASGQVINKTCGAIGEVIAESVSMQNDSSFYISRLTIIFSEKLYNETIECTANIGDSETSSEIIVISKGTKIEL